MENQAPISKVRLKFRPKTSDGFFFSLETRFLGIKSPNNYQFLVQNLTLNSESVEAIKTLKLLKKIVTRFKNYFRKIVIFEKKNPANLIFEFLENIA
jgi:hypothetical protein